MSENIIKFEKPALDKNEKLDSLIGALESAKAMETAGRDMRIKCEEEIIKIMGCKDEGSFTYKTDQYKVTTLGKLNRSVDWKAYAKIENLFNEGNQPVKHKLELDTKKLKELEKASPQDYALMTKVITTKPYKPAVSFSKLESK